jgi:hypothetical protein
VFLFSLLVNRVHFVPGPRLGHLARRVQHLDGGLQILLLDDVVALEDRRGPVAGEARPPTRGGRSGAPG